MPLGNLTSQFFANIYLNELDKFIKHTLEAKYYIRYVDDFIILHQYLDQLIKWKGDIDIFLKNELKIELHKDKSKLIPLTKPIQFLGFRIFNHFKLLKRFNRKNIGRRIDKFYSLLEEDRIDYDKIYEVLKGSFDYMKNANTYLLRKKMSEKFERNFSKEISSFEVNKYIKCFGKFAKR